MEEEEEEEALVEVVDVDDDVVVVAVVLEEAEDAAEALVKVSALVLVHCYHELRIQEGQASMKASIVVEIFFEAFSASLRNHPNHHHMIQNDLFYDYRHDEPPRLQIHHQGQLQLPPNHEKEASKSQNHQC